MEVARVTNIKLILGFITVFYGSISCTNPANTISTNQTVRYNKTIVSSQETFELGFFRPRNSMYYYVGIWYKKISIQTVVWVANPDKPLIDTSCELTMAIQGLLILRNTTTGDVIWSLVNSTTTPVSHPIGELLDTGNFIISEEGDSISQEDPIWQSFDFLQDTYLPEVKLGWIDLVKRKERHLTSRKSEDDPSSGEFTYSIDTRGYPQAVIKKGQEIVSRGGPWNGLRFTGYFNSIPNAIYNFTFVLNQREIYCEYDLLNSSVTRVVLHPTGSLQRMLWIDRTQEWSVYASRLNDECDKYALCGPFGICNMDKFPLCECLKGFEPTSADEWKLQDWSEGCQHTITLDCNPGEGFKKYTNLKLPDTQGSWSNKTMTLAECEKTCKRNCSCTAYTHLNISGTGSGCLLWFGNLTDIRMFPERGDILYIRLSGSELDNSRRIGVQVIVPIAVVVSAILVSICLIYRFYKKKQQEEGIPENELQHDPEIRSDDEDLELPLFGLSTILKATNNFSDDVKLGEGGFGPVYKGVLEDEQEIAVKRLAKTSSQGLQEFKNEVISISKLQHRNLVKLLGYCLEEDEKMLIYEYMPNKGLDSFIFDKTRSEVLDWSARYRIINGVARGLLYLHQDSRLRIIHRDLKASNILLDTDMNPKISDFGMARTFEGSQIESNTNRVVGTYGYMAPEYAGDGMFSIKSDVYSFGVLVLEIVSGEKNRRFIRNEQWNNLIGHAWGLYNEGKSLQLVAKHLDESINVSEALRSIHVGLLCVQSYPEDRPTMTSVILMLGSEGPLPSPKEPGFYVGNIKRGTPQSSSSYGTSSNNGMSISSLKGR